jgi:hypothetical protein
MSAELLKIMTAARVMTTERERERERESDREGGRERR